MTVLMNLRTPETLKDAFAETCRNQYSSMTAEINRFMREYVKTHQLSAVEYGRRDPRAVDSYVRTNDKTGGVNYRQNPETGTWEPVGERDW